MPQGEMGDRFVRVGSLFDGSGGFPLGGIIAGIVWEVNNANK